MYVCLCKGISERTVRACIRSGATTIREVGAACGAGTDCGSCRGMIREMIEDADEAPSSMHMHLPVVSPA
jgi:bacterioferritin-associated ferredoxin